MLPGGLGLHFFVSVLYWEQQYKKKGIHLWVFLNF